MADEYLLKSVHDEYAQRVDAEMERLTDEDKRQNERIKMLEEEQKNITDLTISVKELAIEVKNAVSEIASQNVRIGNLEKRDGEKWQKIVGAVISAVVGGLATLAISGFFGG